MGQNLRKHVPFEFALDPSCVGHAIAITDAHPRATVLTAQVPRVAKCTASGADSFRLLRLYVCAFCMPERTQCTICWLRSSWWEREFDSTRAKHVWNQAGECPASMQILGTPVGTEEFEDAACEERIKEEEKLWNTNS